MKDILTVKEAAEYLRVSRSSVWRWCKNGTLTSAFQVGRNWRIHRAEVEAIVVGQSLSQRNQKIDKSTITERRP